MTVATAALFDALCGSLRIRLPADELDSMYVWMDVRCGVSSGAFAGQPQPVKDLELTLVCDCVTGGWLCCFFAPVTSCCRFHGPRPSSVCGFSRAITAHNLGRCSSCLQAACCLFISAFIIQSSMCCRLHRPCKICSTPDIVWSWATRSYAFPARVDSRCSLADAEACRCGVTWAPCLLAMHASVCHRQLP